MSAPNEVTLTLRRKDMEMVVFALHIQAKQCEDANNEFAAHAYRRIAAALADPAPAARADDANSLDADRFERILAVARWAWATDDYDRHGDGDLSPDLALDDVIAQLQPGDLGVWRYEPRLEPELLPRAAMRRVADQGQAGGGRGRE